ncbi:hypothetical protein WJX73_004234 [Symbiochloris irregularis]|uniref:F-box domain-containing protein n=1 Tax=Symbiochloris irregularis TaxID=706552 RepID=A0AAW1P2T9_9CHLO
MRNPTKSSSACRTSWNSLPEELLALIYVKLDFKSVARAELSCRAWNTVLRSPKVRGLSGPFSLELDELLPAVMRPGGIRSQTFTLSQLLLPLARWLGARIAIGRLHLLTTKCQACSSRHPCNKYSHDAAGGLAMLVAGLQGRKFDMHLKLECERHSLPIIAHGQSWTLHSCQACL